MVKTRVIKLRDKGAFQKSGTGRLDHGRASHFDDEIAFSKRFLLRNHLLRAIYVEFT